MTTLTFTGRSTATSTRRGLATVPALAGIAYAASWLTGLAVSSSSTDVTSSGAEVVAGSAGHPAASVAQFVLTEGAASLFLVVVAVALVRAGRRAGSAGPARLTLVTGVAAGAIALVQCLLGVYLAGWVAPAGDAGTAGTLSDAINRLDGLKMLTLAVTAVAGIVLARRTGLLPRWLRYEGVALVVAIAVSGIGYLLLVNGLALAAWVSLPLLVVWVTGAGIVLGRSGR